MSKGMDKSVGVNVFNVEHEIKHNTWLAKM